MSARYHDITLHNCTAGHRCPVLTPPLQLMYIGLSRIFYNSTANVKAFCNLCQEERGRKCACPLVNGKTRRPTKYTMGSKTGCRYFRCC